MVVHFSKRMTTIFLSTTVSLRKQVKGVDLQVRYALETCLSLPRTGKIFRLMKRSQRLSSAVYAANLKTCLCKVQPNCSNISRLCPCSSVFKQNNRCIENTIICTASLFLYIFIIPLLTSCAYCFPIGC